MSLPRRLTRAAAAMLVAFAAAAVSAGVSCGGEGEGWFVLNTPLGSDLMRLPAEAAPGTVRQAATLGAAPSLMASERDRVVLLYPANTAETDGQQTWAIRQVSLASLVPGVIPSPSPLPPLMVRGTPLDLAVARGELAAIVERGAAERELWRFAGDAWNRSPWPEGFDESRPARLMVVAGAIAVWQGQVDHARTSVWRSEVGDRWTSTAIPAIDPRSRIAECGDQLVALTRQADGATLAALVMPNGLVTIARIAPGVGDQWIVPVSRGFAIVESDGAVLPRLSLRLFSPSGAILYDGPALTTAAVSGEALAMLAVLLLSLLSSVLVFVLRPEGATRDVVTLPPDTALAGPGIRFTAGAIDVALGLGAGWLAARAIGFESDASAVGAIRFGWGGFLMSLALMILLGALAEATWGRSIGKALVGCRVVSASGGRISWRQAFGRNVVRFLCPPLGLAWMVQPPGGSASLFGTVVIVGLPPADGSAAG